VRAIQNRRLRSAEMAAREMGRVSLADALSLTLLFAEQAELERYERAAVRWAVRYAETAHTITLRELELLTAALLALPTPARATAAKVVADLARSHGQVLVARAAEGWSRKGGEEVSDHSSLQIINEGPMRRWPLSPAQGWRSRPLWPF
jgi:hypothetical protein